MLFFLSSGNDEVANGCYCWSAWNQARIFNKGACSLSANSSKYFSTHTGQPDFSFTALGEIAGFPVLLIEYSFSGKDSRLLNEFLPFSSASSNII